MLIVGSAAQKLELGVHFDEFNIKDGVMVDNVSERGLTVIAARLNLLNQF